MLGLLKGGSLSECMSSPWEPVGNIARVGGIKEWRFGTSDKVVFLCCLLAFSFRHDMI